MLFTLGKEAYKIKRGWLCLFSRVVFGEAFIINGEIEIKILDFYPNHRIRVGIEAPKHVEIFRKEIFLKLEQAKSKEQKKETLEEKE